MGRITLTVLFVVLTICATNAQMAVSSIALNPAVFSGAFEASLGSGSADECYSVTVGALAYVYSHCDLAVYSTGSCSCFKGDVDCSDLTTTAGLTVDYSSTLFVEAGLAIACEAELDAIVVAPTTTTTTTTTPPAPTTTTTTTTTPPAPTTTTTTTTPPAPTTTTTDCMTPTCCSCCCGCCSCGSCGCGSGSCCTTAELPSTTTTGTTTTTTGTTTETTTTGTTTTTAAP